MEFQVLHRGAAGVQKGLTLLHIIRCALAYTYVKLYESYSHFPVFVLLMLPLLYYLHQDSVSYKLHIIFFSFKTQVPGSFIINSQNYQTITLHCCAYSLHYACSFNHSVWGLDNEDLLYIMQIETPFSFKTANKNLLRVILCQATVRKLMQ